MLSYRDTEQVSLTSISDSQAYTVISQMKQNLIMINHTQSKYLTISIFRKLIISINKGRFIE
jgi:hypothetical protein